MSPEEFFSLPPGVALRVLFDCLDEGTAQALRNQAKPVAPKPPKYDQMIFRSGGVMFASECDLEGLRFWHKRSTEPGDPKYADANKKRAETLARWIAWREWYPDATWSGERDRNPVVARPPSSKPTVYQRNGGGNRPPPPPPDDGVNPEDEVPF